MEALAGFHSFSKQHFSLDQVKLFPESVIFREGLQQVMFDEVLTLSAYSPSRFPVSRIRNIAWSLDHDYKFRTIASCIEKCAGILDHGDLNVTNLLWKNTDPDELRAIIDFQFVHQGSPEADIARVLTLGISRKSRRINTQRYLNHYFSMLEKLSENGNAPITFDELIEQYNIILPVVSNFTLFGIGLYYKLYSDASLGETVMKEKNLEELLDRAEGIIEDIEKINQ